MSLRSSIPASEWAGIRMASFRISNEHFHQRAKLVLQEEPAIETEVRTAIAGITEVACLDRSRGKTRQSVVANSRQSKPNKNQGVEPKHFNLKIREEFARFN